MGSSYARRGLRERRVIGIVMAAGAGRRLHPLTDDLPKTLLPVDADRSILDLILSNLAHVGLDRIVIVCGFAAHRLREQATTLERRHAVRLELVYNDRAEEWNNAYSLWCARESFREGALVVNGDTVHPRSVEQQLLAGRDRDVMLAVDDSKPLAAEEMKVRLAADGTLLQVSKEMDPGDARGEYIGVALIEPRAATRVAAALETTWRRDPSRYYEDGFQELVDRGGEIGVVRVGGTDWCEVDDHADYLTARELACRC
jgi:choline kinase